MGQVAQGEVHGKNVFVFKDYLGILGDREEDFEMEEEEQMQEVKETESTTEVVKPAVAELESRNGWAGWAQKAISKMKDGLWYGSDTESLRMCFPVQISIRYLLTFLLYV